MKNVQFVNENKISTYLLLVNNGPIPLNVERRAFNVHFKIVCNISNSFEIV